MGRKAKLWTYSAGAKPHMVTVYEDVPDGFLQVRVWDPTRRGGRGNWMRRSLRHRDRDVAKVYALDQASKLAQGADEILRDRASLWMVFKQYEVHRTPRKTESEQRSDLRRFEMWTRILGATKEPHNVSLGEWERFIDRRRSGEINARGVEMPDEKRRAVRARAVEADCLFLKWVFNWASNWRTARGHYLMTENPVRGYEIPRERNPRRPVATHDRYQALRSVSDKHTMEIRWGRTHLECRSYVSELLDLATGTGRRLSAILGLTYSDLLLTKTRQLPYGAIRWRAETDKSGTESIVPMGPVVRQALDRIQAERPGIGSAFMFPSPGDPSVPMSRHLADKWLREIERDAGSDPQEGSLWHAFRRMWATARKDLPVQDVAKAGGWKTAHVVQDIYQQATAHDTLRVVLHDATVREEIV